MNLPNITPKIYSLETLVDYTLPGDAANIDITGLLGNSYKLFEIYTKLKSTDNVAHRSFSLLLNNDSGANYKYQYVIGSDASASALRNNAATGIPSGYHCSGYDHFWSFAKTEILTPSGKTREFFNRNIGNDGTVNGYINYITMGGYWTNTADQITRIVIAPSSANIKAGSQIIILGVK